MTTTKAQNGKFIAYYRVSTARQGESGLGLEAQRKAVETYLNGGSWELVGEFVEVESGKRKNRPQLNAALAAAKKAGAVLVIAKLDRLARNLHFISGLMESGVEFVAADNPAANRLTVQILAAVAEDEARRISERTKAALAAAKERGVELGKNGAKLAQDNRKEAQERARNLAPVLEEIREAGITTVRGIADELNARNIATPRGGRWHVASVQRVLKRLAA